MDDLISRQAVKDWLQRWIGYLDNDMIARMQCRVIDIPSVQPERKKGEWLKLTNTNHTYVCSVCGRMLVNITDGKNKVKKNYPFCHCGADMRGEDNEAN